MLDHETICQLAGVLIILGSMFLIFTRKIYLDPVTKQPIHDIKLSFLGRLRTNSSTLVLIFLGVVLLFIYPLLHPGVSNPDQTQYFAVEQDVATDSQAPIVAYAMATQTTVGSTHHLHILFPDLPDNSYLPHLVLHISCKFLEFPIPKATSRGRTISIEGISVQDTDCVQPSASVPTFLPNTTEKPSGFKGIN